MVNVKNLLRLAIISASLCFAQEGDDWRLDLLKTKGLSAETATLESFRKARIVSEDQLATFVEFLSAEEFAKREQAQKEILLMGKEVLPLLNKLPLSDDPEVQMRLQKIEQSLRTSVHLAEDELLLRAVESLLHERKNPGTADPNGKIYVEFFGKAQPSLMKGYRGLRFLKDAEMKGSVKAGMLRLDGKRAGEGDQRLLLDAKQCIGEEVFPDQFQVSAKVGGGGDGAGAYHVGISIGNVRTLFHPGYSGGAFRFQRVGDLGLITENRDMGFDVEADKLFSMTIDVERLDHDQVKLEVMISNGEKSFVTQQAVSAQVIGKVTHISLDRSGRTGGDAIFDDFVVDMAGQ